MELTSEHWTYNGLLFAAIVLYRVANALIINTQFDPDEYWQTLEPAYCLAFSTEHNCAFTWEWTRRMETEPNTDFVFGADKTHLRWIEEALQGPVRSFVPILPIYFLYILLKSIHFDTTWMVAKAPLLLNALIVAAPTDFSVYYISQFAFGTENEKHKHGVFHKIENWALLASVTNWFNGYALVRTYSNSMETALTAIGIGMLCPELFGNVHEKSDFKVRLGARLAFLLGGISVVIRFTSLAAWIPVGLIICGRRKSFWSSFYYLLHLCILPGLAGVIVGCIVDRIFYGFWAIPFLGSFHFNVLLGYGELYGSHPWFWYFIAGLPAIAGILTPLFVIETFACARRYKIQKKKLLEFPEVILLTIIAVYVCFHSISAHKEFRFIMPILPLVCILTGKTMHHYFVHTPNRPPLLQRRRSIIFAMLILFNYPHLIFLSTSHQGAPISVNQAVAAYVADFTKRNGIKNATVMTTQPKSFSIHYLMGCHSTPLYSHLHVQTEKNTDDAIVIDAWHLDCSPKCRSEAFTTCESDRFTSNPLDFMITEYGILLETCQDTEDKTCGDSGVPSVSGGRKRLPQLLVIFEEDMHKNGGAMIDLLSSVGMEKNEKFRHTIKAVSIIKEFQHRKNNDNDALILRLPLGMALKFEYHYMILFEQTKTYVSND